MTNGWIPILFPSPVTTGSELVTSYSAGDVWVEIVQCLCHSWHWCGTPSQSKTSTSSKKEETRTKLWKTKPNQATPTLSLFCSHPLNWTNSFSNCVGDTNTLAALLPLPCYKIIYFVINFPRSLVMLSCASVKPGNFMGQQKIILYTCFLWAWVQI